jgi:hypothetical protein
LESGEKVDFTLKNQFTVKIIEQGLADDRTYYGWLSTTIYKLIP